MTSGKWTREIMQLFNFLLFTWFIILIHVWLWQFALCFSASPGYSVLPDKRRKQTRMTHDSFTQSNCLTLLATHTHTHTSTPHWRMLQITLLTAYLAGASGLQSNNYCSGLWMASLVVSSEIKQLSFHTLQRSLSKPRSYVVLLCAGAPFVEYRAAPSTIAGFSPVRSWLLASCLFALHY